MSTVKSTTMPTAKLTTKPTTKSTTKPTTEKSIKLTFPKVTGDETRDVNQLLPTIKILVLAGLYLCKQKGIPFRISETWRSPAAQHRDFLSGKSKLDSGLSTHEYRVSIDGYTDPKLTGGQLYHVPSLKAAALVFKEFGAIWGGDWDNDSRTDDEKFVDMPHLQFVTIEEQKILYKLKTPDAIEAWLKKKFVKQLKKAEEVLKGRRV